MRLSSLCPLALSLIHISLSVTAKTRYSQREAAATVEPLPGGCIRMVFTEPQRAVTPGQAVVFYDGRCV